MKHPVRIVLSALVGSFCLLTMSCSGEKQLYSWGDYEDAYYDYTKDPSEKNEKDLVKTFEKMEKRINKSPRKTLPPGIYAEKAYILIKQGNKDEAIILLDKEIAAYPESKDFIERIKASIKK